MHVIVIGILVWSIVCMLAMAFIAGASNRHDRRP